MNAETINLIAVIVLGLVALGALVAQAYGKRKGDETLVKALEPYQPIAQLLLAQLDSALAKYGTLLAPVHDLALAAGTLVDEPADFANKVLPPEVTEAIRVVLGYAKTLTDGEAQPLGEVKRE
jgi:hypothetical protein